MNSKIYNGNVQPNPKEFKIQVDDEGTIRTWNGTEWIEATAGEGGSGSGNSEDFLYIRIPSFAYGFYTDIDVLNNKIVYYKQLADGVEATYETPDEFLDAHGTNTLATIPNMINWDDKYALIYLVNLNYQSPVAAYHFDILSNKDVRVILADTNEEVYSDRWDPLLQNNQKCIYSDGDDLNSQNNIDIVDSIYIVDADGNKLFTFKKWNRYASVEE